MQSLTRAQSAALSKPPLMHPVIFRHYRLLHNLQRGGYRLTPHFIRQFVLI